MGGCKSKEVSIHGGHVFGGDVSMKQGKSAGKGTGGTVTRKKSKKEKAADNRKTDALIKSYKSKIDDLDGEPSDDDKRADLETLCGANAALRPLCQWEGVALPPGWFSAAAIRKDGVPTGVDYVYALNGHVQSRKPQWYPNRHEDAKVPGLLPGWGKTPSRSRPGQYVYAHNKIAGLRVGAVPDLACALAPLRTADGGPLAPGWKQCERGDVPGRYYYENQPVEIAAAADNTHTFLADRTRLHVRAQLRPWEAHSCERGPMLCCDFFSWGWQDHVRAHQPAAHGAGAPRVRRGQRGGVHAGGGSADRGRARGAQEPKKAQAASEGAAQGRRASGAGERAPAEEIVVKVIERCEL